jgi:hypothetical protein
LEQNWYFLYELYSNWLEELLIKFICY